MPSSEALLYLRRLTMSLSATLSPSVGLQLRAHRVSIERRQLYSLVMLHANFFITPIIGLGNDVCLAG